MIRTLIAAALALTSITAHADEDVGVATVKEATELRETASLGARVVANLRAGVPIIAELRVENGFRRVMTGGGAVGYVSASALALEAAQPPARTEDAPATTATDEDARSIASSAAAAVRAEARENARTRDVAYGVMWSAVAVGALTALAGTYVESCTGSGATRVCANGNTNLIRGGYLIIGLGPLIGWAMMPKE